jgi:signal transduction histidine kinase
VYEWQEIDVGATVERVVKSLANTIAHKGAKVIIKNLPPAWGDPTAIEQIFANLIGNALNYLDPARGGEIEIGVAETVGALDLWTYYVKDNGLGIAEGHMPKLFLAFQRLHPNIAPGEGIGLPLVRRMVERHGGRIWVESVEDRGSTFFVSLPARPPRGMTDGERSATTIEAETGGSAPCLPSQSALFWRKTMTDTRP